MRRDEQGGRKEIVAWHTETVVSSSLEKRSSWHLRAQVVLDVEPLSLEDVLKSLCHLTALRVGQHLL